MKQGLARAHPVVGITYYIGAAVLTMTFYHPYFLISALLMMILVNLSQDGGREMRRFAGLYLLTGGLMLFINPLLSHRGATILFYLFDQPITLESILFGGLTAISITAVLLVFTSFNIIMDADKIMFLFSRFLQNTTMMLLLAMRFVPLFRLRLREIREVQKTRPIVRGKSGFLANCREGMQGLNILLARSLEDAVYTAQSMRARGYHLPVKRTFYFEYRWRRLDVVAEAVFMLLLITLALFYGGGAMEYTVYPRFQFPQITGCGVMAFVVYILFLATPILWKAGEKHGVYPL